MTHHTPETLAQLPTSEILALYNRLTGQSVKRFSDRATAIKRTLKAIEAAKPVVTNERVRSERKAKLVALFTAGGEVTLERICEELGCSDKVARNAIDHVRNSGLVVCLVGRKTWRIA